MGSFNHKCNFSQLPAIYGDRIVVLVGLRITKNTLGLDEFSPGNSFTPISVPIRGIYNDYGSIEQVDHTPGIEALEKYFDMNVEDIVNCAERISSECEDQVKEVYKKITNKLLKETSYKEYKCHDLKLSYIMEHEDIFDYLISMNNKPIKDRYYWRIPHDILGNLGYNKNIIGKNYNYDTIIWTHDNLPQLKEECYIWKTQDFNDYSKTIHTINELCEYIKCDIPKQYEQPYYEYCFIKDIDNINDKQSTIYHLSMILNNNEYSFNRYATYGLFDKSQSCWGLNNLKLITLGDNNQHLDIKYMKEVIEIALLYNSMTMLQMTWGNTNYYHQEVDYNNHINFLKQCITLAEEKIKENKP